jgi:hypothetical protein
LEETVPTIDARQHIVLFIVVITGIAGGDNCPYLFARLCEVQKEKPAQSVSRGLLFVSILPEADFFVLEYYTEPWHLPKLHCSEIIGKVGITTGG